MAVAFFLSGLVISRFQPRAWVLAVYDVMVGLVFVGGLLFFAFWGCNTKAIQGVNQIGGQYQYAPPPSSFSRFSPIFLEIPPQKRSKSDDL